MKMQYEGKHPVFVGVLNGCFMFMADLMKQIHIPCEISFVKLASYSGMNAGAVNELIGLGIDLSDRHVVIVEDVVDTGNALTHTISALEKLNVASISVCTLLLKPAKLQYNFDNIMYVGFEVGEEFVVGYGLDYNGQCRNLRNIYKLIGDGGE
jgi:hypoxanthine phosphoribosyltransferase